MLGIEGPDVEVLDAVRLVYVMQGSALAQGAAQEAAGVSAGALRIPLEQVRLGVGGQRPLCQDQVRHQGQPLLVELEG